MNLAAGAWCHAIRCVAKVAAKALGLGACRNVRQARRGWQPSPLVFSNSAFTFWCSGLSADGSAGRSYFLPISALRIQALRVLRRDLVASPSFPMVAYISRRIWWFSYLKAPVK